MASPGTSGLRPSRSSDALSRIAVSRPDSSNGPLEDPLEDCLRTQRSPGRSCYLPGLLQWRGQDLNLRPSGSEPSGSRLRRSALRRIRPGRRISSRRAGALSSAFVRVRWCWSGSRPVRASAASSRRSFRRTLFIPGPHDERSASGRNRAAQPAERRTERDHVNAPHRVRSATKAVSAEAMAVAGPKAQRSTPLDDARLPTVLSAR